MATLYRTADGERRVRAWCRDRLASWAVPHRTSTTGTSLGPTHLVEAGDGDTVCVYLPGTNFNAATSLGVLGALAARCRVVAADLPGQPGLSSSTRPRPETEGYARWLGELLDAVRADHPDDRLVLAGHSRGAAVALSGPLAVDRLVLVSPAGVAPVRMSSGILRTALPWMVRPTPTRSQALLQLMSGTDAEPDPALVAWMTLVARDSRSTGAPGPLPDDLLSRWRGHDVVLAVGSHDCFFPPDRLRPGAQARLGVGVEVLAGRGHLAVEEAPEAVAELVTTRR
ncbi:MAG TPA: alpha/beta hydrolase [Nocardioidaceae bacterium]